MLYLVTEARLLSYNELPYCSTKYPLHNHQGYEHVNWEDRNICLQVIQSDS